MLAIPIASLARPGGNVSGLTQMCRVEQLEGEPLFAGRPQASGGFAGSNGGASGSGVNPAAGDRDQILRDHNRQVDEWRLAVDAVNEELADRPLRLAGTGSKTRRSTAPAWGGWTSCSARNK